MGGVGADYTGQNHNIRGFKVGTFSKGETQRFNPRRKFVEYDLTRAGTWPRTFTTTFLMAESDGSGAFLEALQALWSVVAEVVEDLVVMAVIAAAAGVGAAVGAPGSPVGMIIGAVVGAAIGLVIHYLSSSLEDDIFDAAPVTFVLDTAQTLFPRGQRKSGIRSESLNHPSGRYTLKYEWELVQ